MTKTQNHACFLLIKKLLEDDKCKGIISHIPSTIASLHTIFQSTTISNKAHYIPLGIKAPLCSENLKKYETINILFSNSWHQSAGGFFLRGGLESLKAFIEIAKVYPNVNLVFRSILSEEITNNPSYKIYIKNDFEILLKKERIKLINKKLKLEEWEEIRQSCQICLLPAARIHVVSLFEAMSYGMTVIASNGWGFEEFISHRQNGIIVSGRKNTVSWIDNDTGFLMENYTPMFELSHSITQKIIQELTYLITEPNELIRIGQSAKDYINNYHHLAQWNSKLKRILDPISINHPSESELKNYKQSISENEAVRSALPLFFFEQVISCESNGLLALQNSDRFHENEKNNIRYMSNSYEVLNKIALEPFIHPNIYYAKKIKKKFLQITIRYLKLMRIHLSHLIEQLMNFHLIFNVRKKNNQLSNKKKSIVFAGKMKPFKKTLVGSHPVFDFISFPPEGYQFTYHNNLPKNPIKIVKVLFQLLKTLSTFFYTAKKRNIPVSFIIKFLISRGLIQQLLLSANQHSIVLLPTYPLICGQVKWIVEIEDMLTLMTPFAYNGNYNHHLEKNSPIIKTLEILFESPNCIAVLSHLKSTALGLRKIFEHNPLVSKKICFIPLSIPDQVISTIQRHQKKNKNIKILFLNGWSQDRLAFFRRGGLDALESFSLLSQEYPHVTLLFRTAIPSLSPHHNNMLQKGIQSGKIIHLHEKISEQALINLYAECDILLFPASRIAVTTLLKAMSHSMAIVASDGFGIEEYVIDGVNGLIARGLHGNSGYIDDEGIFRENYIPSLNPNSDVTTHCYQLMKQLIDNPERLANLQTSTREHFLKNHNMDRWNQLFKEILDNEINDQSDETYQPLHTKNNQKEEVTVL